MNKNMELQVLMQFKSSNDDVKTRTSYALF